jgi:hypothetical protein
VSLPTLPLAGLLSLVPLTSMAEAWPLGELAAPSGLSLSLMELLFEENPWSGEMLVVVRLLAPTIVEDLDTPLMLRTDMDWACRTWGVPAAATLATAPDLVVIEMMASPVERGVSAPEVPQFFEQYRLEGPVCIWELF